MTNAEHKLINVLVTGGSGFIGLAVVEKLVQRGHRVIATSHLDIDNLPAHKNLQWIRWDVMNEPLPNVDWVDLQAILHLAISVNIFDFPKQAVPLYELSVAATFRLLEAARSNGVARLVAASTGDVLGDCDQPLREDNVLYMPNSFYGATKACAELLLRSYQSILSTAIVRLFHPYGPRGDRYLVNRLLRSVIEGNEIVIEGDDGISLNPVWIDDLALGLCLAIESEERGIFHFAGKEVVTIRELVEVMGAIVNKKPAIRSELKKCIKRHAGAYDNTKSILGYDPQVALQDGLRKLLKPNVQ